MVECNACGGDNPDPAYKACPECRCKWRKAKMSPQKDARLAAWNWMKQWGVELGAMAEGTPHLITIRHALLGKDAE